MRQLSLTEATQALEGFSDSLQQRFPGDRFELVGQPETVGNALRGSWQFGPVTGTDFALLDQALTSGITDTPPTSARSLGDALAPRPVLRLTVTTTLPDVAVSVRLLLSGLARPKEGCEGTPKPSPS